MTATPPEPLRMQVVDTELLRRIMEHPARGTRWSVREIAGVIGCSVGTISHMRTGERKTVPTELARRFAEAVGVETRVLFVPAMSTKSDTTPAGV